VLPENYKGINLIVKEIVFGDKNIIENSQVGAIGKNAISLNNIFEQSE